jgi:hypothetical protein
VEGKPGQKGKTVALDVNVSNARIEDMMKLAVRSKQAGMTGAVSFQAKLVIPPGERDIMEKLRLDARFGLASAKFTSFDMQQKVAKLSDRARGDTDDQPSPGSVASNFRGHFVSRDGVIRFSNLTFSVPGARIDLKGSYGLRSEELDFDGTATMDAKISQMTTGVKSFLLKAIDPLFQRGKAGAVIPIQINGTRDKPKFGLDVGRALRRK